MLENLIVWLDCCKSFLAIVFACMFIHIFQPRVCSQGSSQNEPFGAKSISSSVKIFQGSYFTQKKKFLVPISFYDLAPATRHNLNKSNKHNIGQKKMCTKNTYGIILEQFKKKTSKIMCCTKSSDSSYFRGEGSVVSRRGNKVSGM